jgi:hypothetical protein
MRSYMIKLALLLFVPAAAIILSGVSCNKKCCELNGSQGVVGDWVWVRSRNYITDTITPAYTGIQKKLSFRFNGTLYITHNDSTSYPYTLQVVPAPTMLGIEKTVTETATYVTADLPAGCVNIKFPTLVVNDQGGYQYSVSQDTLQISNSTCLAPFSSIYVRSN